MHKDTAEVVQQYLAAIGIQCELQLPDWSTRVPRGGQGQYDIAVHGVVAENNDPDGLTPLSIRRCPRPTAARSGERAAHAAALAHGRAEFDQAKRVEIYKDMQRAASRRCRWPGSPGALRATAWIAGEGFTNLPGELTNSSGRTLEETYFG